jgi:hypothetical protein
MPFWKLDICNFKKLIKYKGSLIYCIFAFFYRKPRNSVSRSKRFRRSAKIVFLHMSTGNCNLAKI